MPNHVTSNLSIKGNPKVLDEIAKLMEGEDSKFDFNGILPMPEVLKGIVKGSTVVDGKRYDNWREVGGKIVPLTDEETADLKKKYGHSDWYEWSIEHWGTKWPAYRVQDPVRASPAELRYEITTAWAPPTPVFQALADRFGVSISVDVSGEVDDEYSYTVEKKRGH